MPFFTGHQWPHVNFPAPSHPTWHASGWKRHRCSTSSSRRGSRRRFRYSSRCSRGARCRRGASLCSGHRTRCQSRGEAQRIPLVRSRTVQVQGTQRWWAHMVACVQRAVPWELPPCASHTSGRRRIHVAELPALRAECSTSPVPLFVICLCCCQASLLLQPQVEM